MNILMFMKDQSRYSSLKKSNNHRVWTSPECLTCLVSVTHDLLKIASANPQIQIRGMQKAYQILNKFSMDNPPTDVANKIYHMIQNLTQKSDLFEELKVKSNALAKEAVGRIRPHVMAASNPQTRLKRGLAAAIAGNVIDFGTAGHTVEMTTDFLEKTYHSIIREGYTIDDSLKLFEFLQEADEIIYIADNAGEIYFDWLLLDFLKDYVDTTLVVKGAPISNDATLEDVKDPIFQEVTRRIITTGSGSLGVSVTENDPAFLTTLRTTDFVIAKGQSNFETLYFYHHQLTEKPIFFVLRTKCSSIATFLGQAIGKNVVMLKKK